MFIAHLSHLEFCISRRKKVYYRLQIIIKMYKWVFSLDTKTDIFENSKIVISISKTIILSGYFTNVKI